MVLQSSDNVVSGSLANTMRDSTKAETRGCITNLLICNVADGDDANDRSRLVNLYQCVLAYLSSLSIYIAKLRTDASS